MLVTRPPEKRNTRYRERSPRHRRKFGTSIATRVPPNTGSAKRRRIFVTDALRSGLPPHIAAKICGHALLDTTMGYAAIYPEDVIAHHRAFIARRRTERPSACDRQSAPDPLI